MRRPVVLQGEGLAVELERMLLREDVLGYPAAVEREEIVVPVFDSLNLRKILAGVLVRDNLGLVGADPGVSVCVVEMPMGIDQMRDGLSRNVGQCLRHLLAGDADPCVDHDKTVLAAHHGDVAAGAFKDRDTVPQLMSGYYGLSGAVLNEAYDAAGLGISRTGAQPSSGGGETRRAYTAKAKTAAGENVFGLHNYLSETGF